MLNDIRSFRNNIYRMYGDNRSVCNVTLCSDMHFESIFGLSDTVFEVFRHNNLRNSVYSVFVWQLVNDIHT